MMVAFWKKLDIIGDWIKDGTFLDDQATDSPFSKHEQRWKVERAML